MKITTADTLDMKECLNNAMNLKSSFIAFAVFGVVYLLLRLTLLFFELPLVFYIIMGANLLATVAFGVKTFSLLNEEGQSLALATSFLTIFFAVTIHIFSLIPATGYVGIGPFNISIIFVSKYLGVVAVGSALFLFAIRNVNCND